MKAIRKLLIALFLSITYGIVGQEFIGTNVRLLKVRETVIDNSANADGTKLNNTYSSEEVGLIKLNNQTNEFNFSIPLYNILSYSRSDSINSLNKAVLANFRATFPLTDMDFFTSGSETSIQVPGELSINGKTRPTTMSLTMQEGFAQDLNARDAHSYPLKVSFSLEISPSDFNMDYETINFTRTISIEVRNGVVNRSTDSR